MNFQAGQIRLVMGNELQPKVFKLTELKLYVFSKVGNLNLQNQFLDPESKSAISITESDC